jgi:F0F1-type ATP synthase membrane subunit c/vacuolar-type H+-ATPase subunit K
MDAKLRMLRIIYTGMLLAGIIYVFLPEVLSRPNRENINPAIYTAFVTLAALMIGMTFIVRQAMIGRALETLQLRPDDTLAITRWRTGYIILFALAETVVLYGLVLRFIGATLKQVVPIYVAGIVLLLLVQPRKP